MTRLATSVGAFPLINPVICGSGEPVMTEAGIRAALKAGAAGVIAKSVNEHPAGGRQLDRADYVRLDASGVPTAGQGVSLFNRSGLTFQFGLRPCAPRSSAWLDNWQTA